MTVRLVWCANDDMHPFECSGPGRCVHCDLVVDPPAHDPARCALCDPERRRVVERFYDYYGERGSDGDG